MTRLDVLGIPLDALRFDDAVNTVLRWQRDDGPADTAHFCNVHLLVSAHDDGVVASAVRAGSLNAMDGMPLVWLARRAIPGAERIAGPDLMLAVMDRGRAAGLRHYLYGGAPGVADALATRMTARFPGLLIAGIAAPPFRQLTGAELERDIARIRAAEPDFVWVGLGAPKQELWVEAAREKLPVRGILAVGAAFDFHAGRRKRAPRWMQKRGLEWLWRLASEPRRLWRRYAVTNSRFVVLVALERFRAGRATPR